MSITKELIISLKVWIVCSTWLSIRGWKAVLIFTSLPNPFWNDLRIVYHYMIWSTKVYHGDSETYLCRFLHNPPTAYVDLTGIKWTDFVILSAISQIESFFLRVWGVPKIKSILISSYFKVRTHISWIRPLGFWCSTFTCWHFGHLDTNSAISLFMQSHQYTSLGLWDTLV